VSAVLFFSVDHLKKRRPDSRHYILDVGLRLKHHSLVINWTYDAKTYDRFYKHHCISYTPGEFVFTFILRLILLTFVSISKIPKPKISGCIATEGQGSKTHSHTHCQSCAHQ